MFEIKLGRYIFAALSLIFIANIETCQKWTSQLWHNPFNLSWRVIGDRSKSLHYEKEWIFIFCILRNKLCYAKAMPNRFLLNANTILGLVPRRLKCFVERKTLLRVIRSRSIAYGTFKVFRYSFSEATPIFFNRFKSYFFLVWSRKIFTSDWL